MARWSSGQDGGLSRPKRGFDSRTGHQVGIYNGEGPPVPIPNTEVKLSSAENTCLATDWEDRSMPTQTGKRRKLCLLYIPP